VALELSDQPNYDDDSVRHLVELGYVDPDIVAAREATLRRELEAEFQQALKPFQRGDLSEAAERLEKLTADDPNWIAPRQLLAEIYYRLGDLARSEAQLEWLTLHAVEQPRLALITGAIALARRDMTGALEALTYAAHVEPELPSVHTLLGTTLARLGRLNEAEQAFQHVLTQRPDDAQALDGLATVYLLQSDYTAAANTALKALEQDMQFFRAHYHLGVALAHIDRPSEAIAALETATKVSPHSAAPYFWLARIAERQLANPARAQHYRTQAQSLARSLQRPGGPSHSARKNRALPDENN
jgi:predicted Zn-dependent protease